MRCPKCGFENPSGELYCQECDWRLDVPYRGERRRNAAAFCAVTLILGVIAAACGFIEQYWVALVVGLVSVVLGGYSINLPRLMETGSRATYTAVAGIGLVCGVVGFILGFAGVLG